MLRKLFLITFFTALILCCLPPVQRPLHELKCQTSDLICPLLVAGTASALYLYRQLHSRFGACQDPCPYIQHWIPDYLISGGTQMLPFWGICQQKIRHVYSIYEPPHYCSAGMGWPLCGKLHFQVTHVPFQLTYL